MQEFSPFFWLMFFHAQRIENAQYKLCYDLVKLVEKVICIYTHEQIHLIAY